MLLSLTTLVTLLLSILAVLCGVIFVLAIVASIRTAAFNSDLRLAAHFARLDYLNERNARRLNAYWAERRMRLCAIANGAK